MSTQKHTLVKFNVPIYVEVREGFDHAITLAGALGMMEDRTGGIFADTDDMTSRPVEYSDLPPEAADYHFEGRPE